MPLYEYRCSECGEEFARLKRVSERAEDVCSCGGTAKQVILTPAKPDWRSLAMGSNPSPEALKRWDKMHRQQADKESKTKREHGDYGKSPGA